MARFFYKCLGKLALITAAALWAGCGNERAEKNAPETNSKASSEINTETKSEQVLSSPFKTKEYIKQRQRNTAKEYINQRTEDSYRGMYDNLAGTLYGSGAEFIPTKAKGSVKILDLSDLEIAPGSSLEGNSLLFVIKQRTPGLRHLYNKFLKKKLGFEGTIVMTLSIVPDGSVSKVSVKSSTTEFKEFDEEIRTAVSRWKFAKSDGTTSVTIPFEFSESSDK